MSDLLASLRQDKHALNLAEISRRAGYSSSYLKHVIAGRRCFNKSAQRRVRKAVASLAVNLSEAVKEDSNV